MPAADRGRSLSGRTEPTGTPEAGSAQAAGAPAISLPKAGGAIRGIGEKFTANLATGTGALTIPLPLSPGRAGFGPQLTLSYDTGAGNGPFGFGWNPALPSITRKTDRGVPRYDAAEPDTFILAGVEDLTPVLSDAGLPVPDDTVTAPGFAIRRYRPRIEGLFARIERWTRAADGDVHWRSISRDNVTTRYGTTPESRIADPGRPERIFSWLICESYDDKGNATLYRYAAEDGAGVDETQAHEANRTAQGRSAQRYLKRILYGNRVSRLVEPDLALAEWLFEVVFDYGEAHIELVPPDPARPTAEQHRLVRAAAGAQGVWPVRPDPFSTYRAGFEVRSYRRCQRVLMFHNFAELGDEPYLVRSTSFDYRDFAGGAAATVAEERANPGSTRFASCIQAVTQAGYLRDEAAPPVIRAGVTYTTYQAAELPPLELEYSRAAVDGTVRELEAGSLDNLPGGLDGTSFRLVDLDGEGLSGILTEQAGGWWYKPNLGQGRFGPLQPVATQPSLAALSSGRRQLLDLAGDGQLDLVTLGGPTPGFYERTAEAGWSDFQSFRSLPNLAWDDPNLRLVDLNGDGHADVLVTEQDAFTWNPSLAEAGFGPSQRVRPALDEERGPRLVFADGEQSIYLADMSGDGLTDLVRVRNGEVCYWPSLGYGRFGPRVVMDGSPRLDEPDQFDQQRVRLADIDGSGASDLIYLGRTGVRLYFNYSGNGWSAPHQPAAFPDVNRLASVMTADLFGNGTACLVWSSPLPGDARRPLRYIELMGGQKPFLLTKVANNLGVETRIRYTPSTTFYLADKAAGRPWLTRLPFPVYVVEQVETYDRISRNRFVTRYAYHHGYFDGEEREFRGFGMVEQWDSETFAALSNSDEFPTGDNVNEASHVPPVYAKTWFHTGAFVDRAHISDFFAGLLDAGDLGEYYREPGLDDAAARALLLPDTALPAGLSAAEMREACRALKGSLLRQELYALDGSPAAAHPYRVSERSYAVRRLQPGGPGNAPAVFLVHPAETLDYQYERNPADPRVGHQLVLEVDGFGNVLKEAAIGYGRRQPDPALPLSADQERQTDRLVTYTERRFTNAIDTAGDYRASLPCETRSYELTGYAPTGAAGRFTPADFVQPGAHGLEHRFDSEPAYEELPTSGRQRRLIEHERALYRPDDLGSAQADSLALLPLGTLEPLALAGESYKLAFTPGLPAQVYQRPREGRPPENLLPDPGALLGGQAADQGGYIDSAVLRGRRLFPADPAEPGWTGSDTAGHWWVPGGRALLSPNIGDSAAEELAYARRRFFLSLRQRDPFGQTSFSTLDDYDLLLLETRDALGNRVTVGERDPAGDITRPANDYRVLQPQLVMDANRNRSAVAFDALGLVVATAAQGKPEDNDGDSLEDLEAQLTEQALLAHLADPLANPQPLLGSATTRLVFDLAAYYRTRADADPQPGVVATLARETHSSNLVDGRATLIQHSLTYFDGFGREIQKKIQAEPERVDGPPRWVGNGWTIFNNKGKPVRRYEPFFSATHGFEFARRAGVSPVLFYDPLDRVVVTLQPDHSYTKVIFDAWGQSTHDANDTVTADPRTDPDVGGFVAVYFAAQSPEWRTWHARRTAAGASTAEQSAAAKAAAHAGTPTLTYLDTLGRPFLAIADAGADALGNPRRFPTRSMLDIEGNQREVRDAVVQNGDALGRIVMRYAYDLLGNRIQQASLEAGARWILNDVTGKPIRAWDSRGHTVRTTYDPLRRPVRSFVTGADPTNPNRELLTERLVYGEQHPAGVERNLRGALYVQLDQAGALTNEEHDFTGNLLRSARRCAREYHRAVDWSAVDAALPGDDATALDPVALEAALAPLLEPETFAGRNRFDALKRVTQLSAPSGDPAGAARTVIQPAYNQANLLERIDVWLARPAEPGGLLDPVAEPPTPTVGVQDIDYDARGRRLRIAYKNGASTRYGYDPETFRLRSLYTRRGAEFTEDCGGEPPPPRFAAPDNPPNGVPCGLQNLHYTYDPAGNITSIRDDAQPTIYFNGRVAAPHADYTYDALYRLTAATGREHIGQLGRPHITWNDAARSRLPQPGDALAMRPYAELYEYDAVGNFLRLAHQADNGSWTRAHAYDEASLLEPAKQSNRLTSTTVGTDPPEPYRYDAHGNLTRMDHLSLMRWDYRDQLQATARQVVGNGGTPETTYYVYDAGGERVRKVTERQAGAGQPARRKDERIYLAGFELYRSYAGDGTTVELERQTQHISDEEQRIALVETRTQGADPAPARLVRYQFGNHLGSAALELSEQARVISYEEYYPYGGTSYQAVRSRTETPKRYRYTGQERDEESGFYYHGARYYAPWLGRWTACDPLGISDHPNLYLYARAGPTRFRDADGKQPREPAVSVSPALITALEEANRANYDGASVNRLLKILDREISKRGFSYYFTRDAVLAHALIRAEAYARHRQLGNPGRATFHAALGVIDSFGVALFGDTAGETARNVGISLVLGAAISRLAAAGRASQLKVQASGDALRARVSARNAPPGEPPPPPPAPPPSPEPTPTPTPSRGQPAADPDATPPFGTPALGRLVNESTTGRYLVRDTAHPRFHAEATVSPRGELSISIRAELESGQRSALLKGYEQFQSILRFFEGQFTSIKGNWQYGSNLARFNELTAPGPGQLSPNAAAAATWTGQQAAAAGFPNARVTFTEGTPGKYTTVQVIFSR